MPLTKKQTNGPTSASETHTVPPQQKPADLSSDEDFIEDADTSEGEDYEGFQAKKRLPVSTFIRRNLQSLMCMLESRCNLQHGD